MIIFRDATVASGKVNLTKISWYVPHVMPADMEKFNLYKIIESKKSLSVAYRKRQCASIAITQDTSFSWRLAVTSAKPRWIIIAFQTNKKSDQTTNPSIFDHINLTNISATLNSKKYPFNDYDLNFAKSLYADSCKEAAQFKSKYYRMDESNPSFNLADYKSLYPIFVIDISKQIEKLKNSATDLEVNMQFGSNVPANTMAYAVVISDKLISFQSDGSKFSVIQN